MNAALTLPSIGDLVDGRFRIERKLGEGGTSTVYEVSHVITDKRFAIKWLLPELALDDTAVDRFIHEARVGGKFAHPHAVQVYDICKANDSFYMLMELLEGESLLSRLERVGRVSVQEACSIVLACAEVLGAAHRKGIIHRDLKPANIFLCPPGEATGQSAEIPKLLDFGISMFCSDLHNMSLVTTPRGSVIGTPLYMSPEQMLGRHTDARSDLYALGAVLYELVSGQPPYTADSYGELVVNVTVTGHVPPLNELVDVDEAFARVVAKAIARAADERYQTAEELSAALKPFIASPAPVIAAEPLAQSQNVPAQNMSMAAGPHAIEFTPAYGTTLRLPRQALGRVLTATAVVGLFAMLGLAVWYRTTAPRAAETDGPRPRPRALANNTPTSAAGEEHAAVLELWNRGSSEMLTGRAAPEDALSARGHSPRVSHRAVPGKKAKARPAEPAASEAPAAAAPSHQGASVSSLSAPPPPPSADSAKPSKTLTSTVPQTGPSHPTAASRKPASPATGPASNPVEQVQLHRSDFDSQTRPPNPSRPPSAQISRKDF